MKKGKKDKQHNDQMKKGKRTNKFVLLPFFIWSLCCLSFCPFSFGHCVVCPFALFHLVIVLFVLFALPNEKGQKDRQHNDQMKKGKRTDNTMTK
jgi:uncharacterized membrane protein YjjP (DUF1212 family)